MMELHKARVVQAKPQADETSNPRFIYRVHNVVDFFDRIKQTLTELDADDLEEIRGLLEGDGLQDSEEGLDLFWPQFEKKSSMPILASIYFTPYGVCLDVMSDDPKSAARLKFESFLGPEDLLQEQTFIPTETLKFRLMSSGFMDDSNDDDDMELIGISDHSYDDDDDDDDFADEADETYDAQELVYAAWESEDKEDRIELAMSALELDPKCVDAISILADEEPDRDKSLKMREKAVAIGEESLVQMLANNSESYLWGFTEARPYMRARLSLARALDAVDRRDEARAHYEALMALNTSDNQGVRYALLDSYLRDKMIDKAGQLIASFDDGSAAWEFGQALYFFIKEGGASPLTIKALKDAKKSNSYIPRLLLGQIKAPKKLPDSYALGSKDEAAIYYNESKLLWEMTPGVLDWLLEYCPKGKPGKA
jgi:tetratricopeptide (TPR) repeat protein